MRDPRAASGGAALDTADRVLALRAAGDLRTAEHELVKEFAANAGAAHRAVKWLHFVGQTWDEQTLGDALHRNGLGPCKFKAAAAKALAEKPVAELTRADVDRCRDIAAHFSGQIARKTTEDELRDVVRGDVADEEEDDSGDDYAEGDSSSSSEDDDAESDDDDEEEAEDEDPDEPVGVTIIRDQRRRRSAPVVEEEEEESDEEEEPPQPAPIARARTPDPPDADEPPPARDAPADVAAPDSLAIAGDFAALPSPMFADLFEEAFAAEGADAAAVLRRMRRADERVAAFDVHYALCIATRARRAAVGDTVRVLALEGGPPRWERARVEREARGALLADFIGGGRRWIESSRQWLYVSEAKREHARGAAKRAAAPAEAEAGAGAGTSRRRRLALK